MELTSNSCYIFIFLFLVDLFFETRARILALFSDTRRVGWVSDQPIRMSTECMFERNFQFVLLLASLIGSSASHLTVLRDVSASGYQKRTFCLEWKDKND